MSDIMTPHSLWKNDEWILEEHKKGAIFGIRRPFVGIRARNMRFWTQLKHLSDLQQDHTQLTQNIVAAYVAGSRFFELKQFRS